MKQPDFSGWTTIENLPCTDARDSGVNPQFFRVRNLFALVTYKPGTRIVVEAEKNGICVNVWIPTVDSNDMTTPYEGRFYMWATYALIEEQSDHELIMWLMNNTACFETHETMEFFKVSGKHVGDPHPYDNVLHGEYMRNHAKIYELQPKEKKDGLQEHQQ